MSGLGIRTARTLTRVLRSGPALLGIAAVTLAGGPSSLGTGIVGGSPPGPAVAIDTDMGVDDAAAVAWLLSQPPGSLRPLDAQRRLGGAPAATVPDLAGAVFVLERELGSETAALVAVVTGRPAARGQTVAALTMGGRLTMVIPAAKAELAGAAFGPDPAAEYLAGLLAVLARTPDNAGWVGDIDEAEMHRRFVADLTAA